MVAAGALVAQQVAGKATRDALFLSSFPVSSLPLAMIASAIASALAVIGFSAALARRAPARVVPVALAAGTVLLLAEWGLSATHPRLAAAAVYLHMAIFGATVLSMFWSLVSEMFDPYTARRVMDRIGLGASLGGVAGGLAAWSAAFLVPVPAMLALVAAFNVAALVAVARAGAGTNNIPVAELSRRGVPVFNAPGANANAVKELVLAGLLIAARNLAPALDFVQRLGGEAGDLDRRVEDGKKAFAGIELPGHTLGVIGLGKIGSLVADAAIRLGMHVTGYDPDITVDAAWSLPSQVRRANSIDELLKASHFVTLHVPLLERTRHLVNARNVEHLRAGGILLNFSREGVVDEAAVLKALRAHRLRAAAIGHGNPL